jgi:hypothetical protein
MRNRDGVRCNVSFICNFQISVFEELGDKFSRFPMKVKNLQFPSSFIVCVVFSSVVFLCFSPIQQTDRDNVRYSG